MRRSVSVRLEEDVHLSLRRRCAQSGVPTSALVRALVHRWLEEQGDEGTGTSTGQAGDPEPARQPGLFGEAR